MRVGRCNRDSDLLASQSLATVKLIRIGSVWRRAQAILRVAVCSRTTVRQVQYTYYSGEAHGNTGDLKLAQIQDGSGNTLDTTYYRYYTGEANGYVHGLKYVFRPESYARLTAALGTSIDSISDSAALVYADDYFEYDGSQRVSETAPDRVVQSTVRSLAGSENDCGAPPPANCAHIRW